MMFEMGAKFDKGWSADNKNTEPTEALVKAYDKHTLHISKEKRKSKSVTVVKPFFLEKKELESLLKTLKKSLATGGTRKENTLEFQGDVQKALTEALRKLSFGIKA